MGIEISVVTGTYNRLGFLQKMVHSARKSIGVGITYEIVVVDGGSEDGTIEWCKEQSDIILIEQGELLGAVKAFNEGFEKSIGEYVIIANDDIVFVDYSIVCALRYMQNNSKVGIGCFYQDRDSRGWHVEVMSAVVDGTNRTVYYGQVCIVPRWLGDEVGWWGDYLHTYGGDNELSARVHEIGYRIEPVPCACIHDLKADDDLRKLNGGDPKSLQGAHPDTIKFYDKWQHGIDVGKLPDDYRKVDERLRIFYTPIYEPGHNIQRRTKYGLRVSLQKVSSVYEFDYMSKSTDEMLDAAFAHSPNLFLMQIQDIRKIDARFMAILRNEHPNAMFFLWNGDYHPENLYSPDYIELLKQFHMSSFNVATVGDVYDKLGVKWMFLQIGIEEWWDEPSSVKHDVVFLANGYSEHRHKLARYLLSLNTRHENELDIGLYGSWPDEFDSLEDTTYDFEKGVSIILSAKFVISDQEWPDARGFVSNRLFQSLYVGGGVVLQQNFDGLEDLLGFKHGEHLLVWDNIDELDKLIIEYIDDDDERERIALNGKKFVEENYTFDNFTERMLKALGYVP